VLGVHDWTFGQLNEKGASRDVELAGINTKCTLATHVREMFGLAVLSSLKIVLDTEFSTPCMLLLRLKINSATLFVLPYTFFSTTRFEGGYNWLGPSPLNQPTFPINVGRYMLM
jgi:hypothetical protein